MKIEAIVFLLCSVFLYGCGVIYLFVTEPEPVGVAGLVLCGTLCLMIGGYFWFVSRRIDPRPEDRADGEIAEGAGELGFFAPASYYPFGMALSAVVTGIGVAFWFPWVIGVGAVFIVLTVGGLLFEFYTGQNENAAQH